MKLSFYSIVCTVIVTLQLNGMELSEERISHAEQAYAREARWSKPVRFVAATAALAATGYVLYHYYLRPTPLLTQDTWRYYEQMPRRDQKELLQTAGAILEKYAEMNKPPVGMLEKTVNYAKTSAWWALTSLGYQLGALAIMGAGGSTMAALKRAVPTHGSLAWYINERTSYTPILSSISTHIQRANGRRHLIALPAQDRTYNIISEDVMPLIQLLIFEVEKILGYIRYMEKNMGSAPASIRENVRSIVGNHDRTIVTTITKLIVLCNGTREHEQFASLINELASEIQLAKGIVEIFA